MFFARQLFIYFIALPAAFLMLSRLYKHFSTLTPANTMTDATRMPVYFVSHGGPNLLDDTEYPPNGPIGKGLRQIGSEIISLKPRGMVVVSGHWEASPHALQVNGKAATPQPLIYDFGGFPQWLYKEQFEHEVDPKLTQQVVELFARENVEIDAVDRGFDHGVWVVLKKAGLAGASFPIVQLSLFQNESMEDHLRLGEILSPLRDQGIVVVGSGMAVHNLRDFFGSQGSSSNGVRPYVEPFDKEIEKAILDTAPESRRKAVADLAKSANLRKAHPTLEHLLPLHVAVGAAGTEARPKKMLEAYQLSVSWSCYKFA
ncbi:Extradiol ring-cleavage dioxygenase, class III enzyme, subunit B [Coemansia spiralis]|nr:Extradiol ring-cleavage dioxygenase, class III enzyme, subunit B [Coemansia spiralis]